MALLVCLLSLMGCPGDRNNRPIGMSPYIFRHTDAWDAANAIMRDDTSMLATELSKKPQLKNLTDPYYGITLLSTAILNNKIKSTQKLLQSGFDPNYINDELNQDRCNPVVSAAKYESTSPEILELLMKYGGDPNSYQAYQQYDGKLVPFGMHAITYAAQNSLEHVKILLRYGANINPPQGAFPVDLASVFDMEILLYLLEHGADYTERFELYTVTKNGKPRDTIEYLNLADRLRLNVYPLDSKEYQYKLKVIDFLREKGIDYSESEIPDKIIKKIKHLHPDDWEEYIQVY